MDSKVPLNRKMISTGVRDRLPTLFEVLNRMSAPPVDLDAFYQYMHDTYSGIEYLDFWLDAAEHVKLLKQNEKEYETPQMPATRKHSPTHHRYDSHDESLLSPMPAPEFDPAGMQRREPTQLDAEKIYQSANKIVTRYFMPQGHREIALPGQIAHEVRQAITTPDNVIHTDIFEPAREYVFDALEREAYPAFLSRRALCNVTQNSALIRLLLGLVALFGGFWLSFCFILLDWSPKRTRVWVVLPYVVGCYLIISSLYDLDPILGFIGRVERERLRTEAIREPYVLQLIKTRSVFVALLIGLSAAALSVLFIFVPGHRL